MRTFNRGEIPVDRLEAHNMSERRFPPPWSVEDIGAAFVVRDHDGQRLAYVYYSRQPAAKLLSRDEARRIAANIAKLPGLLGK